MIVTIHQPNFIPWKPFFDKIDEADIFVCLSHCQFEKNGYQNRFNRNNKWHTMSVKKGMVPIKDKEYNDPERDWNKLTKTFPELVEFDTYIGKNLLSTNVAIIKHIMNKMNIDTGFEMDWFTHLKGTHRLVDICVQLGADQYLAGAGGKDYLDESLFEEEGIEVIYQKYTNKDHIMEHLWNY